MTLRYVEVKSLGEILAADTNCHSSSFGPTTNKRGEQLEFFISQYNINIEKSYLPIYESRGAKNMHRYNTNNQTGGLSICLVCE